MPGRARCVWLPRARTLSWARHVCSTQHQPAFRISSTSCSTSCLTRCTWVRRETAPNTVLLLISCSPSSVLLFPPVGLRLGESIINHLFAKVVPNPKNDTQRARWEELCRAANVTCRPVAVKDTYMLPSLPLAKLLRLIGQFPYDEAFAADSVDCIQLATLAECFVEVFDNIRMRNTSPEMEAVSCSLPQASNLSNASPLSSLPADLGDGAVLCCHPGGEEPAVVSPRTGRSCGAGDEAG